MIINKKEYADNGIFEERYSQEYSSLKIYPLVGILEREAGLLSDLAYEIRKKGVRCNCLIYSSGEITEFFKDNLIHFDKIVITDDLEYNFIDTNIIFLWNNTDLTLEYDSTNTTNVALVPENEDYNDFFDYQFKLSNSNKVLYFSDKFVYNIFQNSFYYYLDNSTFDNSTFNYDNLICYSMIVKNGGTLLKQVLTENLDLIDRWCILDTGSTDGSQNVIKEVLCNKKGNLYEEPFINFRDSRNRCLELAGKDCKYIIMLDDTYVVKEAKNLRKFLNEIRGDQVSDTFSMLIKSNDNEYFSNRIIKSSTDLRYIYKIHEVINPVNNMNINVPSQKAHIFDYRSEYMEKRTLERKKYDLEVLFEEYNENPEDPRYLYYIAQTYSCMGDTINKAKYFELRLLHLEDGYIQEKIDTFFELARTYNFHISPITKKEYSPNQELSPKEWGICENLYTKAWELDKSRPDSLYFIGIRYYLTNNFDKAYYFFKQAFELGYPLNSQYSLKPTLTYEFLPKFLSTVCYHTKDYSLGIKACDRFLGNTTQTTQSTKSTDLNFIREWRGIHEKMKYFEQESTTTTPFKFDKPVFCIVTDGGWSEWTGKDILSRGLGGSETWVIEMATYIKKNTDYYVIVFCNTSISENFENVGYNPIKLFYQFVANNIIDYCIISRYNHYIPVAIHGHAINIGIIFHDLPIDQTVIIKDDKLKWIFGLTDWHCQYIRNMFPMFNNKVHKINYGIDPFKFGRGDIPKVKNSFIYSSFANRGLLILLRLWKKIKNRFNDATLHIYSDINHYWIKNNYPDQHKELVILLELLKNDGVYYHSWVDKATLANAWNTAEYFFYPCIFEETFCLTAMEAAISKTFVITNGLAALSETVSNRGLIVPGNCFSKEWQTEILDKLFEYMEFSLNKEELLSMNYQWAYDRTWDTQSKDFLKILIN